MAAGLAGAPSPDLLEIAAAHVRLAEATRAQTQLWGRIGGSEAERASARLLAEQLRPSLGSVELESFSFTAFRPTQWRVAAGFAALRSAMPAPFEARFPDGLVRAPLAEVSPEGDWSRVRGKWVFLKASTGGSAATTVIREKLLYQRAVEAGAAGMLFSLPTPPGTWRSVVPVDKPYALKDERYPDGRRPIPCFSLDAEDGERLQAGATVSASIAYEPETRREALNTVGRLPGPGPQVAILNHLDSFFSGAIDNASGIATTVGIARRLAAMAPATRRSGFWLVGLAAHHDSAAGMRAFLARDPARAAAIGQWILLEHTDAATAELNNGRVAYLGSQGWPEVRAALPRLARASGVMTVDPPARDACIADLYVNCGQARSFCLMNVPLYYHTDHDTLDRITRQGLEAAVDFHLRLLEATGSIG